MYTHMYLKEGDKLHQKLYLSKGKALIAMADNPPFGSPILHWNNLIGYYGQYNNTIEVYLDPKSNIEHIADFQSLDEVATLLFFILLFIPT